MCLWVTRNGCATYISYTKLLPKRLPAQSLQATGNCILKASTPRASPSQRNSGPPTCPAGEAGKPPTGSPQQQRAQD